MPKVRVPAGFEEGEVRLAGVEPNENEMRLGSPRNEHVRVDERDPRDAQVREDDDGKYVGVKVDYVEPIKRFFAEEYGVEYDDLETGGGEADPESEADGDSETNPDSVDGPLPDADGTSEAHWRTVTGAIEQGHYDDELDTVEANDDRESVAEAIAERRETLED